MGHLVFVALCHVFSRVQKQHNQTKAGWYGPSLDIQQENIFFFLLERKLTLSSVATAFNPSLIDYFNRR